MPTVETTHVKSIINLSIMESKYLQACIAAANVWPYEGSNLVRLAEIFRPRQWRYPLHHAGTKAQRLRYLIRSGACADVPWQCKFKRKQLFSANVTAQCKSFLAHC